MPHVYFTIAGTRSYTADATPSLISPVAREPLSGYLGEVKGVTETHLQDEAEAFERKDRRLTKHIQTGIGQADLEQTKLNEVEKAWQERGKKPVFPLWLHYLVLALLMVGEFAINELAFRSYEDRPLLNFLMTTLIGTVIIVCAHFVGRTLKKPDKNATENWLMVAAVSIAIAVSWGIASARAEYIAAKDSTQPVSTGRSVLASGQDPRELPSGDDRSRSLWMFMAFQAGAFLAGMLTAYASADPLEEQRRRRTKAVAKLDHAYTDREKTWQRSRERADQWCSTADQIQSAYVGENTKHRSDGVRPSDLTFIDPKLPDILVAYPEPPRMESKVSAVANHLNGQDQKATVPIRSRQSSSREVK